MPNVLSKLGKDSCGLVSVEIQDISGLERLNEKVENPF